MTPPSTTAERGDPPSIGPPSSPPMPPFLYDEAPVSKDWPAI